MVRSEDLMELHEAVIRLIGAMDQTYGSPNPANVETAEANLDRVLVQTGIGRPALPGPVADAAESLRDGGPLVRDFRRLLDPDINVATVDEVCALSEYLSRTDALLHEIDQAQAEAPT